MYNKCVKGKYLTNSTMINLPETRVIVILDDPAAKRRGFYRPIWSDAPNGTQGSPIIGTYGSYRTIRVAAQHAMRLNPGYPVYRNGRQVGA